MVNHSENEFYTRFLFKIDALPQDFTFPLDVSGTFFNNLSPDVREFLTSEGVQVPPRPPTETNHQGNQRLLLVINETVKPEKKFRTTKAAVQPVSGSLHNKTCMGMIGGNPSTKMDGLVISFQSEESNSMVEESMEEYALASAEAAYKYPGKHVL